MQKKKNNIFLNNLVLQSKQVGATSFTKVRQKY